MSKPHALFLFAGIFALGFAAAAHAQDIEVFFDDFEGGAAAQWSPTSTASTVELTEFLGNFSNGSATLTLTGLPEHTAVTLNFDFYAIDSWDGDGSCGGGGPDYFRVTEGGNILFFESFGVVNQDTLCNQSHDDAPDAFVNSGFNGSWLEAIYRDLDGGFTFPHTGSTLTIVFDDDDSLQGLADESWGIDNVSVRIDGAHEQVPLLSWWSIGLMILVLSGFAVGRLRQR